MVKLSHIYALLILWSLIRLAEREDQIKPDESDLKAEHLLERFKNLVQLSVAKLRKTYSSGYDLIYLNGSLGISCNEFEKLKKELKSFLYMLDSKRHALFNHKYRLLLAQINILIDEIPRFNLETFDNSSFYQRMGLCFLSLCNSLCRFFSNLECSVSKLEEYNRKIDRLQMIAYEFQYLGDKRRPMKKGKRKLVKKRDALHSSDDDDFRLDSRRDEFRSSRHNIKRRPDQFHSSDQFRRRRDQFGASEDFGRRRREDVRFVRKKEEKRTRKQQYPKVRRLQSSSLHPLIHLISKLKYSKMVDRLYSVTQDYWDTLVNKLNELFAV